MAAIRDKECWPEKKAVSAPRSAEPQSRYLSAGFPVDLSGLYQNLDRANQAVGRLDGLTTLLPDTRLFLYLYVRKEALLSSQIEGHL